MYETTVTSGALLSNIYFFLKIVFFVRLISNLNLERHCTKMLASDIRQKLKFLTGW